jgi:rRNA maturation endonuclease Nob1
VDADGWQTVAKPKAAKEVPICRFFNSPGGCKKPDGSRCRLRHERDAAVAAQVLAEIKAKRAANKALKAAAAAAGALVPTVAATNAPVGATSSTPMGRGIASVSTLNMDSPAAAAPVAASAEEEDGEGDWICPTGDAAASASGATTYVSGDALPFGKERLRGADALDGTVAAGPARKPVVLLTTDFAMQNVALQMGLQLMTTQGKLIRSVRSFVLKCDACGAVAPRNNMIFCDRCGNAALARLGVTIGQDGSPRYHYRKNREFNLRGTVYSIPAPKPGKAGQTKAEMLLRPDQLISGHWARVANAKFKPESMFIDTSAGASDLLADPGRGDSQRRQGAANPDLVFGYGKKNPNEARRKRK